MTKRFDPLALLTLLDDHDIEFVVIGGVAAAALGSPMVTFDLDICYARHRENLERLADALREVNATLRGVSEPVPFLLDADTLERGDHFTFDTDLGPIDVLGKPAGSTGYDELVRNALAVDLQGLRVMITSLEDLIRMKEAAGRPKDLIALENLSALRDEIEEQGK